MRAKYSDDRVNRNKEKTIVHGRAVHVACRGLCHMAPKQSENMSAVRWQCIVWAWKTDGAIARSSEDFRSPTSDTTTRIWDVETGAIVGKPLNGHSDYVTSVSYSPDGEHIVSGPFDSTICLWRSFPPISTQLSPSITQSKLNFARHLTQMAGSEIQTSCIGCLHTVV